VGSRYVWNGAASDLGAAADWTSLVTGAAATAAPGTLDFATIGLAGIVSGTLSVGTLALSADIRLAGQVGAGVLSLAGGTLDLTSGGALAVRGAAALAGALNLGPGGVASGSGAVDGAVSLAASATLTASGGALGVFGPVSGTGTLGIGTGATPFLAGGVDAGLTASFSASTGTLGLYQPAGSIGLHVVGFGGSDAIDIVGGSYQSAAWNGGTLTLAGSNGTLALPVGGKPGASGVLALPDGFGGTLIELAPAATKLTTTSGTLTLGRAGALTLATGSGSGGVVVPAGTVALAGTVRAGRMAQSGELVVQAGGVISATSLTVSGLVTVYAGGTLALGAVALGGGTLDLDPSAVASVGAAATSAGTLGIGAGTTVSGAGRIDAPLDCAGTVAAAGGALGLFGTATGAGTLMVGTGATLFLAGATAPGLTLAFAGASGTLSLFAPGICGAAVTGFVPGDIIDCGIALDGAVAADGALALSRGGIDLARIPLVGDFSAATLTVQPDGRGGTLIGVINCFVAGTRIATPDGERPVETLRPGDAVLTPDGTRRLCWVGSQAIDAMAAPELRPVRIAANALRPGLPHRDLLLSPEHGIALAGSPLVPAVALVNGRSIRREAPVVVSYHHIGLESHGLVLAEGVAAESFLPAGGGVGFTWQEGALPRAMTPCLPRLEQGEALEALRQHLDAGAVAPSSPAGSLRGHLERATAGPAGWRLEGWACDERAGDALLRLLLRHAGAVRGVVIANRWRADLERAGLRGGRCGFVAHTALPPEKIALVRAEDGAALPSSVAVRPARVRNASHAGSNANIRSGHDIH
jgi:hypothetical protein